MGAVSALGLLLSCAVGASTFVAFDSRAMVGESEQIVQGKVVELRSFWNEDGRVIVTEATVEVTETLLGSGASRVTVRVPGGQVGDFRVEATGFPVFERGQEVILFLQHDSRLGVERVVGHQQGHFEVVHRDDGVSLAVPMIEDARLFTRDGRLAPAARSMELNTFKNRVRELAFEIQDVR